MNEPHTDKTRALEEAVRLARESAQTGGGPFGAVVLTASGERVWGTNEVTASHDPTAHAEVVALRKASALLGTHDLSGAVLYSSCEPCPMCLAAALWARVDRVVFAADRHDAARSGFDDSLFHDYMSNPDPEVLPLEPFRVEGYLSPFEAWADNPDRIDY